MCVMLSGEVDAQLHGCLLTMGDQTVAGVAHPLTNYAAVAAGASFTASRQNSVSASDVRRQTMVYTGISVVITLRNGLLFVLFVGC